MDITSGRNVQGTDITSKGNVQKTDTQNQFTVQEKNIQGTDITNERNVQGTDITSEKNVQILYTQNQYMYTQGMYRGQTLHTNHFTVQVLIKPVYSTCIHRKCTGMEPN